MPVSAFNTRLLAAASMLCVAGPAAGADDAQALVGEAMAAMGGRPQLEGLHALKLTLRTVAYRIDDSERATGPDWLNVRDGSAWRDEDHRLYRQEGTEGSAPRDR